jgi:hypothetical protein
MAIGLLLVGALCVAVSLVTVIEHQRTAQELEPQRVRQKQAPVQSQVDLVRLWRHWLLAAGALVVVFLVASLAMARFRRRLVRLITAKRAPPTPAEDVWKMHKVPEYVLDDDHLDDDDAPTD